jgi:hypothetical protein
MPVIHNYVPPRKSLGRRRSWDVCEMPRASLRLPTMQGAREYVEAASQMSYGPMLCRKSAEVASVAK